MIHFLSLLRVALGNQQSLPTTPTPQEWEQLLLMSAKQSLVGVAFTGVERLPKEQMPPIEVILDWSAVVNHLENENLKLNDMCCKVSSIFKQENINACILKGQGVGALYDTPLRRSTGDIDVWMEGGRDVVVDYISRNFPRTEAPEHGGHHIKTVLKGGIDMEVHFLPAELYNPNNDKRVRRWFDAVEKSQWGNTIDVKVSDGTMLPISVPTPSFNQVFILMHLFYHWAFEGCGMKQIVDYYYVLKSSSPDKDSIRMLKHIGLFPFAQAIMYIMQQLGLPASHMLTEPSAKLGALLLDDILTVGTVSAEELATGKYSKEGKLHKMMRRTRRMFKMMPLAPSELIWVVPENLFGWILGRTK